MLKLIIKSAIKPRGITLNSASFQFRTFLSPSYYCKEVWDKRLNSPIIQKVNLNELYHELDQRYQRTRQISAVDVDIFAVAIKDELFIGELMDLVHKLRMTADTGNTLNSTSHAVVRALMNCGKSEDLVNALDDRLNYGLFLDYYTANILLDTFWKDKKFVLGARVASQLMLQENFGHAISTDLSLLHCYNYLANPDSSWPDPPKLDEPEEEVKIRVKYLRNPYDDDHFDLKNDKKIVGKTLAMTCKNKVDSLNKSLRILGLVLYNKLEQAKSEIDNTILYKEIIDLMPETSEFDKSEIKIESNSEIPNLLKNRVEKSVIENSERDIADQCKVYSEWEKERLEAIKEQEKRLLTAQRLAHIEEIQKSLKEKETKLWFFENEEQIELEIEEKQAVAPKIEETKQKSGKVDLDYVPPEVKSRKTN